MTSQKAHPFVALKLENVNNQSSWDACCFCGKKGHSGCPLPYADNITIKDVLNKMLKVEDNISFYNGGRGCKDLVLQIDWNNAKKIPLDMLLYDVHMLFI